MKIALIGARGQLGTALQATLGENVVPLDRSRIDVGDAGSVEACLSVVKPDLVVNAAAYNFVDRAEQEPEAAHRVNALGPKYVAEYCEGHDAALLHVSTDYVFSGLVRDGVAEAASFRTDAGSVGHGEPAVRTQPYAETDEPEPQSVYAKSKLAGEEFVRGLCHRHFVLRTCGLYGRAQSAGKGNFVKTMLRLAGERDELRVVNDQRCTPTSAADLAAWIAALIGTDAYGLYHATSAGSCTWYEFAVEIFRCATDCRLSLRERTPAEAIENEQANAPFRGAKGDNTRRVSVAPISTAEFGAAAKRPPFSVLDCSKLQQVTGLTFRPWETALAEYVGEECRG
jgi:dTDP-4-dehydrorhamnose reductase